MDDDLSHYSREELEAMLRQAKAPQPPPESAGSLPSEDTIQQGIRTHFAKLALGPDAETLLASYLMAFREERLHLALAQLDVWQATAPRAQQLQLPEVYTELKTTFTNVEGEHRQGKRPKEIVESERLPLTAPAFASVVKKAVLLGDPGSGKSTFANMLALCLAGELLADTAINLTRVPDWSDPPLPDWKKENRRLLPVFLTLREFGGGKKTLWDHLVNSLDTTYGGSTSAAIESVFKEEGGLLILDGLDEVPDARNTRSGIVASVHQFTTRFPRARILVTSRPYAYEHDGWALEGFTATRLAPFDADQRTQFLERWYAHAAPKKGISPADCERRRDTLHTQIEAQEHLRDLAEIPLLLTLICLLDLQTGGAVPQNREELYDRSVQLLLEIWQKPKFGPHAPTLQAFLGVTGGELQRCIEAVAFRFHDEQGDRPGLADIPEGEVLSALRHLAKSKIEEGANTDQLADYLENRAGLLTHHGTIYRFPHRSFQEYLAARHLSDLDDGEIVAHLRTDPKVKWREPFLLAGAKIKKSRIPAAWDLICRVLDSLPVDDFGKFTDIDWRIVALLGRLIYEIRGHDDEPTLNSAQRGLLNRIRSLNAALIEYPDQPLPILERHPAGLVLGQIGDPRYGVGCDDNGIPEIAWVPIAVAESEPSYAISRYPVTNAQFHAFIVGGGYEDEQSWQGEDWDGREFRRTNPQPEESRYPEPNTPRVDISWFEAKAFCRWLSGKLSQPVDLPSDPQWERVARGTEGREYPWGDSTDAIETRCNFSETEINRTSSVGLFPSGAAVENEQSIDDLSGNVWEWSNDWRDDDKDTKSLRGGSFDSLTWFVRAAIRDWDDPSYRGGSLGFRVVSSPFESPET